MSTINYVSPENLARFKSKADLAYAAKSAVDTLIGSDTGKSARAIAAEELAAQLIPSNAKEALNTLSEVAAWIQSHPEDASAINAAVSALQAKVDTTGTVSAAISAAISALGISAYAKTADLGALASKDTVAESDLATALKEKVNAAADGNHAHGNKALLDTYTQTETNLADAVSKKHSHSNKSVLDNISAAKVNAWDAKSDFSGDYNDLANKPSIPAAYTHPTNHPASMITGLAAVATSGKYSDLDGAPTFTEATDAQIDALFE